MKFRTVVFISVTSIILVGCSSSPSPVTAPSLAPYHKEQFDKTLSGGLPDKSRRILEDYWVTDEEWQDVVNDFRTCVEGQGTEANVGTDRASFGVSKERQEEIRKQYPDEVEAEKQFNIEDENVMDCALKTIMTVDVHYFEPRNNPEGVSYAESVRRCYAKHDDLSLEGFSESDIDEKLNDDNYHSTATQQQLNCMQNPAYGDWNP